MRVEPTKPRFNVQQTDAGLKVVIPARRNWFVLLFVCVWLAAWSFGGVSALTEFFRAESSAPRAFLAVWLTGWALAELFAVQTVLWQLYGREVLVISSSGLIHRIAAAGLGRTREFDLGVISDLRVQPQVFAPMMGHASAFPRVFGFTYGMIAFDYGAKTYRIGSELDEAEARLILNQIGRYFPRKVTNAT